MKSSRVEEVFDSTCLSDRWAISGTSVMISSRSRRIPAVETNYVIDAKEDHFLSTGLVISAMNAVRDCGLNRNTKKSEDVRQ